MSKSCETCKAPLADSAADFCGRSCWEEWHDKERVTAEQQSKARDAVTEFTRVWGELAESLPHDYDCHLTCTEAEALAGLFRVVGASDAADAILAAHAEFDEPGEAHHKDARKA
jgi:hypothetical protein